MSFSNESREANPAQLAFMRRTANLLRHSNLQFLGHCVRHWQALKPSIGLRQWLRSSLLDSTHRLAGDGLREMIARLTDDELLALARSD